MSNFADKIKEQEEEAKTQGYSSQGGEWFKFTEGDNSFRILVEPEMIFERFNPGTKRYETCYTDCGFTGSAKFMTWIQDRKDGQIKLAKLPYIMGSTIAKLQTEEDYSFESFPMPYDIKVNAVGAGTKEVTYTTIPRAKREDVEPWVLEELKKQTPVSDVIIKMKENQKKKHIEDGTWQKEQDRKAELGKTIAPMRDAEIAAREGADEDYPESTGEVKF